MLLFFVKDKFEPNLKEILYVTIWRHPPQFWSHFHIGQTIKRQLHNNLYGICQRWQPEVTFLTHLIALLSKYYYFMIIWRIYLCVLKSRLHCEWDTNWVSCVSIVNSVIFWFPSQNLMIVRQFTCINSRLYAPLKRPRVSQDMARPSSGSLHTDKQLLLYGHPQT